MLQSINHIGIAVKNLDDSLNVFKNIFEVEEFHRETVAEQKVDVASFKCGDVLIELTAPTDDESPIAKYIANKGEGIHHIGFNSSDINSDLKRLADSGIKLINDTPKTGAHDMLIAFMHPKSTNSVLMEICQHK
jgi:methylmalonyl-CoA/ethylmalonyl-CoA epimerase